MSDRNNFHYKAMDWYDLLGFNRNYMNDSGITREEYCSKYIENAYQNCLSMLKQWTLAEINLFYKIPSFNYCAGKIENLTELTGKIQEAYSILKDPEKRKEYDFEIFGIFCHEYPENEVADEKFKDRAILLLEKEDEWDWDEELNGVYWKTHLSSNYWKNWQEEIKTAKYKEEIKFYIRKFGELRMFIMKSTDWEKKPRLWGQGAIENYVEKIKQKEIELQNISKEEWWKEKNNPSRDGEWREMSVEEISQSKMLETIFGESPKYGWNFAQKKQDKPNNKNIPIKENKDNVVPLKKLHELSQWMKENNIEEIFLEKDNKLICKKSSDNGNIYFSTGTNIPNANLIFKNTGKNSVSRQELEEKLNNGNFGEGTVNNFGLTPWLIGSLVVGSAIILSFIIRKKTQRSDYVK